jgi:hypothetical protein
MSLQVLQLMRILIKQYEHAEYHDLNRICDNKGITNLVGHVRRGSIFVVLN